MADTPSSNTAPVSEDDFLADRQKFFAGFGSATLFAVIAIVVLMALMGIFLA